MNVYDFDKTIYSGDSTIDFYFFCVKRNPFILIYVFYQIFGFFLFYLKAIDKTKLKEIFYIFIRGLNNIEELLEEFWEINENKIYEWYTNQKKDNDLIISASPEFLLIPICKRLGISNLIASKVDSKTGRTFGKNCYGEEKVNRFNDAFGRVEQVGEFYSDSLSDTPMAMISENAYLVTKGKVDKWITK